MTDAHFHPYNLIEYYPDAENERKKAGIAASASSTFINEFEYNKKLSINAEEEGAAALYCSFAIHPQLCAKWTEDNAKEELETSINFLENLAKKNLLDGIGETGFDLFKEYYRNSEKIQEEVFNCHLDIAIKYNLPLTLHLRKAIQKILPYSKMLKKLPHVIVHSWPASHEEGKLLIKKGINVYFSFSSTIIKNHKKAMKSAALFPLERLLLETDAPWQPPYGKSYSSWTDLIQISEAMAALRKEAGSPCSSIEEIIHVTSENFNNIFNRTKEN